MKKPRSWAEAAELHPGIHSIDDERSWTPKDFDGVHDGPPFVVNLNEGWHWDGLNHFGIGSFNELRQEWDRIYFDPEELS